MSDFIIGLTGSIAMGKTTTARAILGFHRASAGSIEVAGYDVASTKSRDLAKILSILRQENHFITRLTVRQLVGFGRFPHSQGRLNRADEEIISRYIDFLDLRDLEGRYLDQLSGGQRQRAYVAMVLCQETEFVLLDEPLNILDMRHSVLMMQHLQRAAAELGRTIMIVLHDINFAAHYADFICTVKDGLITHFGPSSEVMNAEMLSQVFDTPVDVIDGPRGPLAVYY